MKPLFALAVVVTLFGIVGHYDKHDQLVEQASITCQNQDMTTTPTKEQCINNQLERNNNK